eukprot:5295011-Pyramimonas_sp.AAC.1
MCDSDDSGDDDDVAVVRNLAADLEKVADKESVEAVKPTHCNKNAFQQAPRTNSSARDPFTPQSRHDSFAFASSSCASCVRDIDDGDHHMDALDDDIAILMSDVLPDLAVKVLVEVP